MTIYDHTITDWLNDLSEVIGFIGNPSNLGIADNSSFGTGDQPSDQVACVSFPLVNLVTCVTAELEIDVRTSAGFPGAQFIVRGEATVLNTPPRWQNGVHLPYANAADSTIATVLENEPPTGIRSIDVTAIVQEIFAGGNWVEDGYVNFWFQGQGPIFTTWGNMRFVGPLGTPPRLIVSGLNSSEIPTPEVGDIHRKTVRTGRWTRGRTFSASKNYRSARSK